MENPAYHTVEQALFFIEKHQGKQPSLEQIAEHVNLSPFHFQRLFKSWAGVTPKRFLQHLTIEAAKEMLADNQNVFDVSYQLGLSGTSRLHDLFVSMEAMTPAQYKNKGSELVIYYNTYTSPFGEYHIACTNRGICSLEFEEKGGLELFVENLRKQWPNASMDESESNTINFHNSIFGKTIEGGKKEIHLNIQGSNFQIQVWKALLKIPMATITSYDQVASYIGKPKASRAVGSAIGKNPIAFIIPCHRVINKIGKIGQYRWGSQRKKAMIAWEKSQQEKNP